MSQHALVQIELPVALDQFKLPEGVNDRLQELLNRQDQGIVLTASERKEAESFWPRWILWVASSSAPAARYVYS